LGGATVNDGNSQPSKPLTGVTVEWHHLVQISLKEPFRLQNRRRFNS
jgi:hypothetical protein